MFRFVVSLLRLPFIFGKILYTFQFSVFFVLLFFILHYTFVVVESIRVCVCASVYFVCFAIVLCWLAGWLTACWYIFLFIPAKVQQQMLNISWEFAKRFFRTTTKNYLLVYCNFFRFYFYLIFFFVSFLDSFRIRHGMACVWLIPTDIDF